MSLQMYGSGRQDPVAMSHYQYPPSARGGDPFEGDAGRDKYGQGKHDNNRDQGDDPPRRAPKTSGHAPLRPASQPVQPVSTTRSPVGTSMYGRQGRPVPPNSTPRWDPTSGQVGNSLSQPYTANYALSTNPVTSHYTLFPKSSAEEISHNDEFPAPCRDQQSQPSAARFAGRSGSNERGKPYHKDEIPMSSSGGDKGETITDSSSHLSRLGQTFIKIGSGQYHTCQNFIDKYPEIRKEALDNFQFEAVRLEQQGKFSMVENCVQQLLLLRECSSKSDEAREDFFNRMKKRDPATLRSFLGNFDQILRVLKAKAASAGPIQHVRSDPQSLGSTNRGPSQVPAVVRHAPEPNRRNGAEKDLPASLRTNSLAGDVSTLDVAELDIRGSEGDHEELDHRYCRRPDAKNFFVVGQVFEMLWHEGAGDKKGGHLSQAEPFNVQRVTKKKGKYNEDVFIHILRMAVVKARDGYCWCVPIHTYNGEGVAKKGLSAEERQAHAIIYMDGTKPAMHLAETRMMFNSPIAVSAASSEQKLDRMSRINFGAVYTVQWNVKVMNVGKVHRRSIFNFEEYSRNGRA